MTDDKTLNFIIKKLQSNNTKEVLFSIKQIRNIGAPPILPYIIDLLSSTKSVEIKKSILSLLNDLKNENCTNEIIIALKNNKYSNIHKDLLNTCWQSGLNYTEYIALFVDMFINRDFDVAFEAFTVLDTFEGAFEDSLIEPLMSDLKKNIENFKETDKEGLFVELIHILEKLKG